MAERMIQANCLHCGTAFKRRQAEARRHPPMFCSKKCMGQGRFSEAGFWSRFAEEGECMVWTGSKNRHGYGTVRFRGSRMMSHQVAWVLTNGPIPDGKSVCHTCDNPACGNPNHLWIGNHAENMADMRRKGRSNRKVDEAMARAIQSSNLPTRVLARRFGVSERTVRCYRPHASPLQAPPDNTDKG